MKTLSQEEFLKLIEGDFKAFYIGNGEIKDEESLSKNLFEIGRTLEIIKNYIVHKDSIFISKDRETIKKEAIEYSTEGCANNTLLEEFKGEEYLLKVEDPFLIKGTLLGKFVYHIYTWPHQFLVFSLNQGRSYFLSPVYDGYVLRTEIINQK